MPVMTFAYGLVEKAGEQRAVAIAQADDAEAHEQLAKRFKAGGLTKVRAADWNRLALSLSDCSLTLEGGLHTQIHTGRSRMLLNPPQAPSSPQWLVVAGQRLPVLGLVGPGSLPSMGADRPAPDEVLELLPDQLDRAANDGTLLAGFARLLDVPAPTAGPGTHTTRI